MIGHSYGGGGALLAGTNHPSLKAVKTSVTRRSRAVAPHEADLRGSAVSAYRENCPY